MNLLFSLYHNNITMNLILSASFLFDQLTYQPLNAEQSFALLILCAMKPRDTHLPIVKFHGRSL